jgi:hypothetical protein
MLTPKAIQARVRHQPFAPFRITTSAGQVFEVRHPELIMIGRRDLLLGRPSTENPTTYDQFIQIALMHVTTVEPVSVPASPGGNGQQ